MRMLCDAPMGGPNEAVLLSKCLLRIAQCAAVFGGDMGVIINLARGALAGALPGLGGSVPSDAPVAKVMRRRDSAGVLSVVGDAAVLTADVRGALREVVGVLLYRRALGAAEAPTAGDDMDECLRHLLRVTARTGDSGMPVSHYFLSLVLSARGDHEGALDHYYAALRCGWPARSDGATDADAMHALWTQAWFGTVRNDVGVLNV